MKKVRTFHQCVFDSRVSDWSDERAPGLCNDGVWLYLERPWWCPDTDTATVHEYNVRDLCQSLNDCYQDEERWNQSYGKPE